MLKRMDGSFPHAQLKTMQPGEEAFRATLFAGVYPPDRGIHAAARIALSEGGVFRSPYPESTKKLVAATSRGVVVNRLCVLPRLGDRYTLTDIRAVRFTASVTAQAFGEEVRVVEYKTAVEMLASDPNAQDSELVQRWKGGVESGHPNASFWSFYAADGGVAQAPSLECVAISSYDTDDTFLGYEVYEQPSIPTDAAWYSGFWRGVFEQAEVLYRPERRVVS